MATITDPPKASFRLSMLLYDTRYRSLTIQAIFLLLMMAGAAWLVSNAIANLAALGKTFDFSFLGNRAGYDINQALIEYNNNMTHGRAMLVGLLNTLLVAAMACVTATVIGVFMGILRLSPNWLISRLAAVYVEGFRNVPLLLWILVIFAVMTESMPQPSAFRGDSATASMLLFDSTAVTNRGVYTVAPQFVTGLGSIFLGPLEISLTFLVLAGVLVAGVLVNRLILAHAEKVQNDTGIRPKTWWKSILVIAGPFLALLWLMGFHWEYPELRGFNFAGGTYMRNSLIAMWIALSLYTGAFIAETVRAGIMAVSRGQTEAAGALGLRPGKIMRLVILPQALRVIIPPMISQYLNIVKNSSLALAVGYMDLRSTLGGITMNQTGRELEAMLLMMAIYLIISLVISSAMNLYNSRVRLKER